MRTNRVIQVLSAFFGALVAVFASAAIGIDFSPENEVSPVTQRSVLMGQSPTNLTHQIADIAQLRSQVQQLQSQLTACRAEASALRLDALMNQPNQQRR